VGTLILTEAIAGQRDEHEKYRAGTVQFGNHLDSRQK